MANPNNITFSSMSIQYRTTTYAEVSVLSAQCNLTAAAASDCQSTEPPVVLPYCELMLAQNTSSNHSYYEEHLVGHFDDHLKYEPYIPTERSFYPQQDPQLYADLSDVKGHHSYGHHSSAFEALSYAHASQTPYQCDALPFGPHGPPPLYSRSNSQSSGSSDQSTASSERIAQPDKFIVRYLYCTELGCNGRFREMAQLKCHLEFVHHILPNRCVHFGCEHSFRFKSQLDEHINTTHAEVQTWKCRRCKRNFSRRLSRSTINRFDSLLSHYHRFHITGKYQCTSCGKHMDCVAKANEHYKQCGTGGVAHLNNGNSTRFYEPYNSGFTSLEAHKPYSLSKSIHQFGDEEEEEAHFAMLNAPSDEQMINYGGLNKDPNEYNFEQCHFVQ